MTPTIEAGKYLDVAVARCTFGFVENPDDWSDSNEVWYFIHSGGSVIRGEPYTYESMKGKYSHQWENFKPSLNIADAMFLVDYFHKRNKAVTITNTLNAHGADWFVRIGNDDYRQAETMPLAICKAVLFYTQEK